MDRGKIQREKAELVARIRDRRAQLDVTLGRLQGTVEQVRELPAKVRANVQRVRSLTALAVAVTAVGLASVLIVRALVGSPRPRRRR
ncbi:MAG: hypothetical protein IPH07_36485 [Deltaproteobacteria bacterium]|nr:hypothetical protein [Deltaproteobacteria bacterium]MBK8235682.1 hypothetical protein [Deltaproteobacteria bacterium]MBK8713318.1 hypothetical protein [Deltaproteobacteria bacterium]MBP7289337.1 hypothetical protein [Nannocystaceae bacterium]